jgi:hypothetical protein
VSFAAGMTVGMGCVAVVMAVVVAVLLEKINIDFGGLLAVVLHGFGAEVVFALDAEAIEVGTQVVQG